jgi:hypothetical protein
MAKFNNAETAERHGLAPRDTPRKLESISECYGSPVDIGFG